MRRLSLACVTTLSLGCFSDPPSTAGGSAADGTSTTGSSSGEVSDDDEDDDDGEDTTGDSTSGSTGRAGTSPTGGPTTGTEDETGGSGESGTTGIDENGIDLFDTACEAMWIDGDVTPISCPGMADPGTPGTVLLVDDFDLPPPERGMGRALVLQPGGSTGLIQGSWIIEEDMLLRGTPRFVADGLCVSMPPGSSCSVGVQIRLFRGANDLATGIIPISEGPPTELDYNFNNTRLEAGDEVLLIALHTKGSSPDEGAAFIEPRLVFD